MGYYNNVLHRMTSFSTSELVFGLRAQKSAHFEYCVHILITFLFLMARQFEFNLFMEQVREPTSLTAAGIVVVDKNLGLTVNIQH